MSRDVLYPLRRIHGKWNEYRCFRKKYIVPFKQKKRKHGKCVFFVMTPTHTNMGDNAITLAAGNLLKHSKIDYVEITMNQLRELRSNGFLGLLNKYPILINGGGNLGTLWFDVEQLIRDIIINNPKSPIKILPSTIYYENSEWGNEELEYAKQIYNAHKNLTIYAREKISFEELQKHFSDVKIAPDLVLSLDENSSADERKGCLICLRNDCEKTVSNDEKERLERIVISLFGENVKYSDTHSSCGVSVEQREEFLNDKLDEFKKAELVITDRLHGMIFCAITATPCIVINSQSPKVKGCYEWIKHLEYIRFCDDVGDIIYAYESMQKQLCIYNNEGLVNYYQELCEDIKTIV